jgi:hypothetical protein
MDKVKKIIEALNELDSEEMQKYHECRLIYPMGQLKTLSLDTTFYELLVPSDA